MELRSFFIGILLMFLILSSANSRADNPSNLFGIELGQDVFKLSELEKFGSQSMRFKIVPKKIMPPFDLYFIAADNDFRVGSVFAMAKVHSDKCDSELKKIAHQIETILGITLNEIIEEGETTLISEDDKTLLAISCNRYRRLGEEQLKDIRLVLASKEITFNLSEVDNIKANKMSKLLRANKTKRREIELVHSHNFSGVWSIDCGENNSGIVIEKIRDNFYNFLVCSSMKCINLPRISSNDIEIVDVDNLKIAEQQYERCIDI